MSKVTRLILGTSFAMLTMPAHAQINLKYDDQHSQPQQNPMALSWYEDDYHEHYYDDPQDLRDEDWVISREGYLPNNAVIGGSEPERTLYICKAFYMESIIPGKVVDGNCNITYNGKEIVISENYKVLTGAGFRWVRASNGKVPQQAITGGMDQNGDAFYVCRVNYLNGKHPGKLSGSYCHFGYAGNEMMRKRYEVLTDIHSD